VSPDLPRGRCRTVIRLAASRGSRPPKPRVPAAPRRKRRVAEASASYLATPLLWRASKAPKRTDALLLDTHAWIWTLHAMRTHMADGAWTHIEAAARERRLYVSDISFWEVSLKAAKGQLTLPTIPRSGLAGRRRTWYPGIGDHP